MVRTRVESFQPNPQTRNYKAVDSESGAIIGYARWTVHPDGQVLEQTVKEAVEARLTPRIPEMREGVARAVHTAIQQDIRELLGIKEEGEGESEGGNAEVRRLAPHVHVDALFTHPDHQRKGVAKALLQNCLREADELGIMTFLEATQDGKPLYLKLGFVIVRTCEVDLTKYGDIASHDLTYMKKLPEKSSNTAQ
ncbi:hypothetical protein N8T08_005805 [Aspergillus melleus]|uniref:Uncharacterized protein n=1 Tax=Aspergillus melleus TaxID=138277 RepID=A0ACC3B220_9EURO|nr:hypothetical protein N8T08_005805 [Aspergillus melleus]